MSETLAQLSHSSGLKTFILNRKGSAIGFRFKDWLDYATTPTGSTHLPGDAAISATDVIIGVGDGTTETFNLVKAYVDSGGYQHTRRIKKPVPGSVLNAKADKSNGRKTRTKPEQAMDIIDRMSIAEKRALLALWTDREREAAADLHDRLARAAKLVDAIEGVDS